MPWRGAALAGWSHLGTSVGKVPAWGGTQKSGGSGSNFSHRHAMVCSGC